MPMYGSLMTQQEQRCSHGQGRDSCLPCKATSAPAALWALWSDVSGHLR